MPGVDGIIGTTPAAKPEAARSRHTGRHTPRPFRRVDMPQAHGKRRPRGIPARHDSARQALHGLALEPIAAHRAAPNSYGFRRERSTAEAIGPCASTLATRDSPAWVLAGDSTAGFDGSSQTGLLPHVPMAQGRLATWVQAGDLERNTFHATDEGTPQGATSSPRLGNLTCDALEQALKAGVTRRTVTLIRDAADFSVTGESEPLLRADVTPVIEPCLAGRGLTRAGAKTRLVHLAEGVDVLGQTSRQYHGKRRLHPAKNGGKNLRDNLRGMRTRHPMAKPAPVIRQLNPGLRGWANAHRHVCRKHIFAAVDFPRDRALGRGAKRRPPNTSTTWMKARSWPSRGGKNGGCTGQEAHGQAIHLITTAATPIHRQVKVPGKAHPSDPADADDCEQRLAKKWATGYDGHANIPWRWQRQGGKCPPGGHPLTPDRRWPVHHKIPRAEGGPHTLDNLR